MKCGWLFFSFETGARSWELVVKFQAAEKVLKYTHRGLFINTKVQQSLFSLRPTVYQNSTCAQSQVCISSNGEQLSVHGKYWISWWIHWIRTETASRSIKRKYCKIAAVQRPWNETRKRRNSRKNFLYGDEHDSQGRIVQKWWNGPRIKYHGHYYGCALWRKAHICQKTDKGFDNKSYSIWPSSQKETRMWYVDLVEPFSFKKLPLWTLTPPQITFQNVTLATKQNQDCSFVIPLSKLRFLWQELFFDDKFIASFCTKTQVLFSLPFQPPPPDFYATKSQ